MKFLHGVFLCLFFMGVGRLISVFWSNDPGLAAKSGIFAIIVGGLVSYGLSKAIRATKKNETNNQSSAQ